MLYIYPDLSVFVKASAELFLPLQSPSRVGFPDPHLVHFSLPLPNTLPHDQPLAMLKKQPRMLFAGTKDPGTVLSFFHGQRSSLPAAPPVCIWHVLKTLARETHPYREDRKRCVESSRQLGLLQMESETISSVASGKGQWFWQEKSGV